MAKTAKIDLAKLDKNKILSVMKERLAATKMRPVSKIHPNPFNKNKMGQQYFEALKANIANPNIGFTTPIILRPHPSLKGEWEIVDGEHRWKAVRDLGLEEVMSIDISEVPEALAKYLMLESNQIRGETKDEDIKKIIKEIEEDESWKKLMQDFDTWSALVTEIPEDDASKYELDDDEMGGTNDSTILISMYLTAEQNDLFRKITGQLRLAHGITLEAAVMDIVKFYEESTGVGSPTGDEETDRKDTDLTSSRIARDIKKAKEKKDKYAVE